MCRSCTASPSTFANARSVAESGAVKSNAVPLAVAASPSASRNIVPRVLRAAQRDDPPASTRPRATVAIRFVYMADSREALVGQSTRALRRKKSRAFGAPSRDRGSVGVPHAFRVCSAAAHAAATSRHHGVRRDDTVFRRCLSVRRARRCGASSAAAPLLWPAPDRRTLPLP